MGQSTWDFIKIFYPVAPIIGIAFIVMVTQYVANQRDDRDDRIKIGQREFEKKESEKRSKSKADIMRFVNNMAANGKDIKTISDFLNYRNLKITQEKIAKIVAKYKKDTHEKINKQSYKQQTK